MLKTLINHVIHSKLNLTIGIFALALIALPITITLLQNQQNLRQLASTRETISLLPIADTYVESVNPNTNYATSNVLRVDGGTDEKISYLKFDLTSLEGKTITDAKLKLFVNNAATGKQTLNDISDNNWDETVTFANKPASGEQFASFGNTANNTYKSIVVTDKVNEKKGQLFSFAISSTNTNIITIRSKEASSNKPTLVVTYTTPITPSDIISPTIPITETEVTEALEPTLLPNDKCASSAADIIVVIDKSLSMSQEISQAKKAARLFVDKIAQNPSNRISLVTFDHGVTLSPLTADFESIKTAITATKELSWGTCIQCAIDKANLEFTERGRNGLNKSIVLLTDGRPTRTASGAATSDLAEAAAFQSIKEGYSDHGYNLFNIGIGKGVRTQFMTETAEYTGGKYYYAPTPAELDEIYLSIATVIGKGTVSGIVYNDANNNANKEDSEVGLTNWLVSLVEINGQFSQNYTTSDTGAYNFTGLCSGKTYRINQIPLEGWRKTSPLNPAYHEVTIASGSPLEDKDFGNVRITKCTDGIDNDSNGYLDRRDSSCHTDWNPDNSNSYDPILQGESGVGESCADSKDNNSNGTIDGADPICHTDGNAGNPQSFDPNLPEFDPNADVIIDLNVFLHGIGSSGDNRNPASNFSNKNPLNPERKAIIEVFNSTNQLAATAEARITYASTSGNFLGSANLGKMATDNYTIKIKTEQHLKNQFPGIQRISAGQTLNLSPISMVTGDVNNDNRLDILDYNILYGCYTSDLMPTPRSCNEVNTLKADLNDEGKVNLFDLNLFIRELSVQSGI